MSSSLISDPPCGGVVSTDLVDRGKEYVTIRTSDDEAITVQKSVAVCCGAIRKRLSEKIQDTNEDGSLTFSNISSVALRHVLEFCRYEWPGDFHCPPVRHPERSEDEYQALVMRHQQGRYARSLGYGSSTLSGTGHHEVGPNGSIVRPRATPRYEAFLESADPAVLCELASAAYYLEVKPLVDLTCRSIADLIKGKTPEEIRTTFKIQNDFSPSEELQVRKSVLQHTMFLPPSATLSDDEQLVIEARVPNSNATDLMPFRTGNPTRDKLRNKLLLRRQTHCNSIPRLKIVHNDGNQTKEKAQQESPKVGVMASIEPNAQIEHPNLKRTKSRRRRKARERQKRVKQQEMEAESSTPGTQQPSAICPPIVPELELDSIDGIDSSIESLNSIETNDPSSLNSSSNDTAEHSSQLQNDLINGNPSSEISESLLETIQKRLKEQQQLERLDEVDKRTSKQSPSEQSKKRKNKKKRKSQRTKSSSSLDAAVSSQAPSYVDSIPDPVTDHFSTDLLPSSINNDLFGQSSSNFATDISLRTLAESLEQVHDHATATSSNQPISSDVKQVEHSLADVQNTHRSDATEEVYPSQCPFFASHFRKGSFGADSAHVRESESQTNTDTAQNDDVGVNDLLENTHASSLYNSHQLPLDLFRFIQTGFEPLQDISSPPPSSMVFPGSKSGHDESEKNESEKNESETDRNSPELSRRSSRSDVSGVQAPELLGQPRAERHDSLGSEEHCEQLEVLVATLRTTVDNLQHQISQTASDREKERLAFENRFSELETRIKVLERLRNSPVSRICGESIVSSEPNKIS